MTLWAVIFGCFLLSAVVQIFYLLRIFSGLAFKRATTEQESNIPIPASVIICAHNELENLKILIPKLRQQQYREFQVVVVLDRTSDGSHEWLSGLGWEELKPVVIDRIPGNFNPKKFALKTAIAAADNPLLVLTDADCYPASDQWLKIMCLKFQPEIELVLGYSPYKRKPGLLNLFIRYETLLTGIQYLSRAIDGHPYMGVGRNLAYRKSFFENSDQLIQHMSVTGGDDDLLVNTNASGISTAICVDRDAVVYTQPKTTISEYLKQKKRHLSVGKHYKSGDKLLLGIFSISHIIFWSSLVSLLVTASTYLVHIFILFVIRQIALSIIVIKSSSRLGDKFPWVALPLVDMLYSIYIGVMGTLALFSKKINWK